MKICLINNLYKPYARGGAERVVELVAEGLEKEEHEVIVIATKPIFKNVECRMSNVECYFISGFYYDLGRMPKFLRLFWHIVDMFDVGSFLKVRAILKKEKPDLVMTHNLKGIGYLIPLAVKLSIIKHIHILHDIQLLHPSGLMIYGREKKIDSVLAKMYASICRWLFNSPSMVISPSKWLMDMHSERGFFKNSKKVVIPNPVDSKNPLYPPLQGGCNNTPFNKGGGGGFKFLYVGQIEEHKGILFLIKAFKKINTPFNKGGGGGFLRSELIIVGDGSQMEEAKKKAGNAPDIKFLGRKNKGEAASLMRQADCLVVPSLCYENSPTVIYEAFAAGLPVLASDLGGIPELLADGAGVLFKPGDERDLEDKMRWVLGNGDKLKNIGEEGSKRVENFGPESYLDKILSV